MAIRVILNKIPQQVRFASSSQVIKLGKPGGPKHAGCGEKELTCSLDGDCKSRAPTTCKTCCNLSKPSITPKYEIPDECHVPSCLPAVKRAERAKKYPGECIDNAADYLKSFCNQVPQVSGTIKKRSGCCRPSAKEVQKMLNKGKAKK